MNYTGSMTLGDLYSRIDWSKADEAGLETQGDSEYDVDGEFKRRYRLTLLEQGLFGEKDHKDTARTLLSEVGVWGQVAELLRSDGRSG